MSCCPVLAGGTRSPHKTNSPSGACVQDQCAEAPAVHVVDALCDTCCGSSLTDDCRRRCAAAAVLWAVHVCIAILLQARWSFTTFRGCCTCNKTVESLQSAYPSSIQVNVMRSKSHPIAIQILVRFWMDGSGMSKRGSAWMNFGWTLDTPFP
jgi:hypothetical protein